MPTLKYILTDDTFIGIQALLCGILGICITIIVGFETSQNTAVIVGLVFSTSCGFIVLRKDLIKSILSWMLIALFAVINVFSFIVAHPTKTFSPIIVAPFFLAELVAFLYLSNFIKRKG